MKGITALIGGNATPAPTPAPQPEPTKPTLKPTSKPSVKGLGALIGGKSSPAPQPEPKLEPKTSSKKNIQAQPSKPQPKYSAPQKTTHSSRNVRSGNKSGSNWRIVVRDTFANTFDLIGDWVYYFAVSRRDFSYGEEELVLGIDPANILRALLAFCIISTLFFLWMILTSLKRSCGKNAICCKCSMNRLMLAELILEDLPQFVLTTYVDYHFAGQLTPAGMLNICSSLGALVNRATAHYEDIQEEKGRGEVSDRYIEMA